MQHIAEPTKRIVLDAAIKSPDKPQNLFILLEMGIINRREYQEALDA